MKVLQSFLLAASLRAGIGLLMAQDRPILVGAHLLTDGSFLVLYEGEPGALYRLMVSEDMDIWDTIAFQTAEISFGDVAFRDRTAPFFRDRFYGIGLPGGDDTFPTLTLTSPTNELTRQPTVLLEGTASDDSGVREVRVNGALLDGTTSFTATIPLSVGTNRFLVSAVDLSPNRNRRSRIVQVRYVPELPVILTQPASQTNLVATTTMFSVSAAGEEPLHYQWRRNGVDLTDSVRIAGANSASLALHGIGASEATGYVVVISNSFGAVTSEVATLTLQIPPGFIAITHGDFAENFDGMGAASTNTPPGWFVGTGTGAISGTNVVVSTGSSTAGGNYSFGSAGSSDRALGSLASGSTQRDTEARFINASGFNLVSFTVDYTGEQWRQGGNSAVKNDLVLQYSTTGTNFTVMGSEFNFSTPYDTGPPGALDGNAAANRVTGIGGTYFPAGAVTNGGVFYLRWVDMDNASSDHAIAVDDLHVEFTFESAP